MHPEKVSFRVAGAEEALEELELTLVSERAYNEGSRKPRSMISRTLKATRAELKAPTAAKPDSGERLLVYDCDYS